MIFSEYFKLEIFIKYNNVQFLKTATCFYTNEREMNTSTIKNYNKQTDELILYWGVNYASIPWKL